MIKTVIFDIDNTLYNFDAAHEAGMEAVCNYVYEQFGWEKEAFTAVYRDVMKELFVYCKSFLEKVADIFGECCISILEKCASPWGDLCRPMEADILC